MKNKTHMQCIILVWQIIFGESFFNHFDFFPVIAARVLFHHKKGNVSGRFPLLIKKKLKRDTEMANRIIWLLHNFSFNRIVKMKALRTTFPL